MHDTTPQTPQPTHHQPHIPYDSNPFTLSFRGFGLLVEFAKGVFITMLVLGILGFMSNVFNSLGDMNQNANPTQSSFNIRDEINQDSSAVSSDPLTAGAIIAIAAIVLGVFVVVIMIAVVISAAYKGFVAAGAVAASERRMITVGEALSAMADRYGDLFKAEFVSTLKIIGGFFLLIVPGVRAYLRYQALPYLIMSDKSMASKSALETSKRLYTNHLMEVYGIQFVGSLIPVVGGAFSAGGMALSAQQLKAYEAAKAQTPETHWLNYLGLIISAVFLVFGFFAVVLLIALVSNNVN